MSSVSQTQPRSPGQGAAAGYGRRFAIGVAAIAVIVGLSLKGAWGTIGRMALAARPHAPDLPLFASLPLAIKIHLLAALVALVLGGVLMSLRKGRLFHRVAGWMWVSLVSLVAGSSLFITSLNHGKLSILHLFTGWTLIVLPLAVMWAKRHEVARHRRTMMGLFYGGLLLAGALAFIPGRLMWRMLLG
jgi:uncharacterized membrane protein